MGEYNPRVTSSGMLTGDPDALKRYQDIAKYYNLTPNQVLFGQDTSVFTNLGTKFDKYGGDSSKTTTATSNYGRDNSAKIDYFLKNKPLDEDALWVIQHMNFLTSYQGI